MLKKLSWMIPLSLCVACPSMPKMMDTEDTSASVSSDSGDEITSSTSEISSTSIGDDNSSTSTSTGTTEELTDTTGEPPMTCNALFADDLEALQDLVDTATEWNPTLTVEQACAEKRVTCEVMENQCGVVELDLEEVGLGENPTSMNQLTKLRKLELFSNNLDSPP